MRFNVKQFFIIPILLIAGQVANAQPYNELNGVLESAFEIGSIESVMIEKNGDVIAQQFTGRMSPNRPTNIKSASKSILSLLVGIAIEEGYLEGVDQPIGEFFEDYFEQNSNPEKEAITIVDLLTMRGGLESTSIRNYGRWVVSSNWHRYVLNGELIAEPGGRMIYSTGSTHLLSVILTRATGMSTREFGNRYLFGPMGINLGGWDRDPQGYYFGGNNMAMSPADMLKIGRMMMDLGKWQDEQVVPQEWILDSVKTYTRSNFNPYDMGYLWWRRSVNGYEVIFAWGHGGQYIMMIPELDVVMAITSNLARVQGRGHQRALFRYLEEDLVPLLSGL
ncbi:serine hydrolase domain-containing protein [Rhodohalobacter halophilus]|uniref:serine hydrolase domain-containing protein n=1 Tax=Rhodohalobacter halophilus TaxID=1812810 RepID=UPI000A03968E|nr:serine hydrolase [Rhodohalobacter halophilus]